MTELVSFPGYCEQCSSETGVCGYLCGADSKSGTAGSYGSAFLFYFFLTSILISTVVSLVYIPIINE